MHCALTTTTSFSPLSLPYFHIKSNSFPTFSYATPFLWNHLPNTVRSASTYMSFGKNLKTFVQLSLSYVDCLPYQKASVAFDCALYSAYPLSTSWLRTSVYWELATC